MLDKLLNIKDIETKQQKWKDHLDSIAEKQGLRKRSEEILEQLQTLENSGDKIDLIDIYILSMSGLVMQANNNFYPERTLTIFRNRIEEILALLPVGQKNNLSFLFADYYRTKSKLFLREGRNEASRWHLLLAARLNGKTKLDATRSHWDNFGIILRYQRDGYISKANNMSRELLKNEGLPTSLLSKLHWQLLVQYRLLGDIKKFNETYQGLMAIDAPDAFRKGALWEKIIFDAKSSCPKLFSFYKKNKLPLKYLVETTLYYFAHGYQKGIDRLPKLTNMRVVRSADHRRLGRYFEAAECLQETLDVEIPMTKRLETIGKILAHLHEFPSIESELLFLSAIHRWTKTRNLKDLASEALHQYQVRMNRDESFEYSMVSIQSKKSA